jgi:colicin import membrane protein
MKRPNFKAPPYLSRPQGRRGGVRSVLLAVAVHGLLGALLLSGIQWKTESPEPVMAELFSPPPQALPAPRVEPKLEPRVEPKVEPKLEPKPLPKADIATETLKKPKDALKKETEAKADLKKLEEKKAEADREEVLKSMVAKAAAAEAKAKAGTGVTPGASAPIVTAGTDRGYGAKVAGTLKANTSFQVPDGLEGNAEALFLVKLKSDCGIIAVELKKSSGLVSWDQAAERGIRRTNPFPAMSNGLCESSLEIARSPKD